MKHKDKKMKQKRHLHTNIDLTVGQLQRHQRHYSFSKSRQRLTLATAQSRVRRGCGKRSNEGTWLQQATENHPICAMRTDLDRLANTSRKKCNALGIGSFDRLSSGKRYNVDCSRQSGCRVEFDEKDCSFSIATRSVYFPYDLHSAKENKTSIERQDKPNEKKGQKPT